MRLTVHTSIDTAKMGAIVNGYQKVIRKAVEATGLRVERLAKQNMTESKLVDTGRLRASMHVQRPGDTFTYNVPGGNKDFGVDGTIKTTVGPDEVVVGTNVEYAAVHEFGGPVKVRQHVRRMKGRAEPVNVRSHIRKVRARPYLTPAYNQVRSEGYLQKRIDRAVRELTK